MNGDTTSHKIEQDESAVDDVLDEYDFSKAKPGRHRGFKGKLIRVLGDDTEQVIKLERDDLPPLVALVMAAISISTLAS